MRDETHSPGQGQTDGGGFRAQSLSSVGCGSLFCRLLVHVMREMRQQRQNYNGASEVKVRLVCAALAVTSLWPWSCLKQLSPQLHSATKFTVRFSNKCNVYMEICFGLNTLWAPNPWRIRWKQPEDKSLYEHCVHVHNRRQQSRLTNNNKDLLVWSERLRLSQVSVSPFINCPHHTTVHPGRMVYHDRTDRN